MTFILLRERGVLAARSCRPAARASSKMRCWVRRPKPGGVVSTQLQMWGVGWEVPTWRASKQLHLGSADLLLQIAKCRSVLVARHGPHVPDGRHDALLPPFVGLDALALAHAEQAVLVAGNGQVVHAPDLAHARLVGDAVRDERLGADLLQLVLGPPHVLEQALLARVLLFLRAEDAGLAGHAVLEARQVWVDDGVARVGKRVERGGVAAGVRGARVERGLRDRKSTRLNSSHMSISYAV